MKSTDSFLTNILDVLQFGTLQVTSTEQIWSFVGKLFK